MTSDFNTSFISDVLKSSLADPPAASVPERSN